MADKTSHIYLPESKKIQDLCQRKQEHDQSIHSYGFQHNTVAHIETAIKSSNTAGVQNTGIRKKIYTRPPTIAPSITTMHLGEYSRCYELY